MILKERTAIGLDDDFRRGLAGAVGVVPAEVIVLEGEGHGFTDANNQQAMRRMLDFLDARLKQ